MCIVDEDQTAVAVMVNKLAQDAGMKVGDSVAIPEPCLKKVKLSHKGTVSVKLVFFALRLFNSMYVLSHLTSYKHLLSFKFLQSF